MRQSRTRGWIFFRPSATIQTTTYGECCMSKKVRRTGRSKTFFHASGPQVWEFLREHKCAIFCMTPYIVLQNKTSSSYIVVNPETNVHDRTRLTLNIVITMKSSVRRPLSFCLRKKPFFSKSSGSHVTAVYRVRIISGSRRGKINFGGTSISTTRFPFVD
jgi:hypothetical protein